MALIFCTNCGARISNQAHSCPQCGNAFNSLNCKECGAEISINDTSCKACGHPTASNQQVFIKAVNPRKNGMGIAGFVLSIIGAVLCWMPIVGFIPLLLGFTFSFIGLIYGISKKKTIVLSIIGLSISGVFFIVAISLITAASNGFGHSNSFMNM